MARCGVVWQAGLGMERRGVDWIGSAGVALQVVIGPVRARLGAAGMSRLDMARHGWQATKR